MLQPCRLLESDTLDPWSEKRSIRQDTAWEFACIYLSWLPWPSEHLVSQTLPYCQLPSNVAEPSTFSSSLLLPSQTVSHYRGAPIRNSPKLTSLKSLFYQHDSPKNYTGVLRLLPDVPPKPVSLVSLAASQSPCFIYPLPRVL